MSVVKQGQSFIDKVTQQTGSFENSLENAILNDVSITEEVAIGKEFKTGKITNKRVVQFFNKKNEPATALPYLVYEEITQVGIGNMIIENTFIVR